MHRVTEFRFRPIITANNKLNNTARSSRSASCDDVDKITATNNKLNESSISLHNGNTENSVKFNVTLEVTSCKGNDVIMMDTFKSNACNDEDGNIVEINDSSLIDKTIDNTDTSIPDTCNNITTNKTIDNASGENDPDNYNNTTTSNTLDASTASDKYTSPRTGRKNKTLDRLSVHSLDSISSVNSTTSSNSSTASETSVWNIDGELVEHPELHFR